MFKTKTLITTSLWLVSLFSIISLFLPPRAAAQWQHLSSKNNQLPKPLGSDQQTASLVLDIDKDGKNDFVIASRRATNSVVWYRRTANGWQQYVIDSTSIPLEAGGDFFDIDGDGDLDISFGGDNGHNKLYWWENPYPNYSPTTNWTRHIIKNDGKTKHHDQAFGDVDGDGKAELVFWNQGEPGLFVAEIPANPKNSNNWPRTKIYTSTSNHEGLALADIDGDGKPDIVGGGLWFKHTSGTSYTSNTIDSSRAFSRVAVGQLINGGRPEVVFSAGDSKGTADMYSWNGSQWVKEKLFDANHGHSLQILDVNKDGNQDIFSAEMNLNNSDPDAKIRTLYGKGNGSFTTEVVVSGNGVHEGKVADLDGDGDLDILAKSYNWDTPRIDVWLQQSSATPPPNNQISLKNWKRYEIDSNKPWRSVVIAATDLDGDGYKDVVTGGWWYKNPKTPGGTWQRKTIGSPLNNMAVLFDVDGNGSVDIVGTKGGGVSGQHTNPNSSEVVWAANNGSGIFTVHQNIPGGKGDFLQGAVAGNLNGKQVALSWHKDGGGVQLLTIPANPTTQQWTRTTVTAANQEEDLSLGDINRDGRNDLLLGTKWLQNTASNWSAHTLNGTSGDPDRNVLADINGDGRLDAIVGFEAINIAGKLAWYEQPATATGTWTERLISPSVIGPMSLDAADMDGDGDIDVVVGEHNYQNSATAKLLVFENTGNGASWGGPYVVHTGDEHHSGAQLVDIDNDGDLDIISIGWQNKKVTLYENTSKPSGSTPPPTPTKPPTNPPAGFDFNGDGKVNLLDFNLFVANKLQTIPKFDTDGNGKVDIFDFSKLVAKLNPQSTPPTNPPATPTLPPTNPDAKELKIIDKEVQFTSADNGFHVLKAQATNIPGIPVNWRVPNDYYTGTWHYRYRLISHPSKKPGRLQTCVWTMPGYKPESCGPQVTHDGTIKDFTEVRSPSQWWSLDNKPVDFTNSTPFLIRAVLRGANGCNVTRHNVNGACWDAEWNNFKDMKFRVTIVMVPQGKTFSGWQNYP